MLDDEKFSYDPASFQMPTFHDARTHFTNGGDTPRDYLERCLEVIRLREPVVQAFVTLNESGARDAADASTARWKAGHPLSSIDGLPIGIKDLLETKDMPTQMGCFAYDGNFPKNDNAAVRALRQAGAVIVGKTVTAELGGNHPGPTTHPFDPARTPGGSSSGSAAAVAAGMLPVAMGSQVGGSIIRPAAFCGNFALKPTQGGIHRGERQATSMSTHGPHAGSIDDMWLTAIEIAKRTGGDPGHRGLMGPDRPPAAIKPDRLIILETEGWGQVDKASHKAFSRLMDNLAENGITLIRRTEHSAVETLEAAIQNAAHVCGTITAWENRWALRNLIDQHPEGVSQRIKDTVEKAETMTPTDYRDLLQMRATVRRAHENISSLAAATITFSCPGPAPFWPGDKAGQPLAPQPTGDPVFNYPSSLIGAPVVTIPMMSVKGLPVGLQVMGQYHADSFVTATARWIHENIAPIQA